jgi:octaprenyl-diphosphate synthase
MTLPLIKALAKANETERSFLIGLIEGEVELSNESLEAASAIIRNSGALNEAYAQARVYAATARAALEQFADSPIRAAMLAVLDYSIEREF